MTNVEESSAGNFTFGLREFEKFLSGDADTLQEHDFLFGQQGLVREWFLDSLDERVDVSSFVDQGFSHEIFLILRNHQEKILNTKMESVGLKGTFHPPSTSSSLVAAVRDVVPEVWNTLKLIAHRISRFVCELLSDDHHNFILRNDELGPYTRIRGLGNVAIESRIPVIISFDSCEWAILPALTRSNVFLYELFVIILSDFGITFDLYKNDGSSFLKFQVYSSNIHTREVIDPEILGVIVGVCHYTGATLDQNFVITSTQIPLPLDSSNAFAPSRLRLQERIEGIVKGSAIDIDRLISNDPDRLPGILLSTSGKKSCIEKKMLFDELTIENYKQFRIGFEFTAAWMIENQDLVYQTMSREDFSAIFTPRHRSDYENYIYTNLEQIHYGRSEASVRDSLEAKLSLSSFEPEAAVRRQLASLLELQIPRWVVSSASSQIGNDEFDFASDGVSTFTGLIASISDGDPQRQMRALFHLLFRKTLLEVSLPVGATQILPSVARADETISHALAVILKQTISSDERLYNRELVPATATANGPMRQSFNLYYGYAGILLTGSEAIRAGIQLSVDTQDRLMALSRIVLEKFHDLMHIVSPSYFGGSLGVLFSLLSSQRAGILDSDQLKIEVALSAISRKVNDLRFLDIIEGISGIAICLRSLPSFDNLLKNNDSIKAMIATCERIIRSSAEQDPDALGLHGDSSLGIPLAGVSHGIQGVKTAVALTFERSDEFYSSTTAFEGQNRLFSPRDNNWKDTRLPVNAPYESNSWCHGAEGFVLTETRISSEKGERPIDLPYDFDLSRWVDTSQNVRATWGLCHGAAGRLVTLNELLHHLSIYPTSELSQKVDATRAKLAASMIRRLQHSLERSAVDYHNHSLMTGICGDILALIQFRNYTSCANPLLLRA